MSEYTLRLEPVDDIMVEADCNANIKIICQFLHPMTDV